MFARAMPRLRCFVRCRLGGELAARFEVDDVIQETFLAAHAAFAEFEPHGVGAFAAWLCRIAENRLRALAEHHRAAKRREPGVDQRITLALARIGDDGPGPATKAEHVEDFEELSAAIAGLESDAREVLLMRYFTGETIEAIATATKRSESAVRRLLGRSTRIVGAQLAKLGEA